MSGNKQKGYIAITSALLIVFLIMVITSALSLSIYFSRFNVFSSEAKERSLALAEACADKALLNFSKNPSYAGNETITVSAPDTCDILPITVQGSQRVIKTHGQFSNTISNIRLVVNATPVSLVSWEEIP